MSNEGADRSILLLVGLVLSAVGIAVLSVLLDAGTNPYLLLLPLVGLFVGLSLVTDGIQRRVELGRISAVALLVGCCPVFVVGLGAIRVYLADPSAVFANLALILGIALLLAGTGMVFLADRKLDLSGSAVARVTD